MMHVILVEPEYEGNLGLAARACKNFGAEGLVLVNPKANHLGSGAAVRSVHAFDLLKNARVVKSLEEAKRGFRYVVGTTAKTANEYNVNRSHLLLEELELVEGMALVFGRESSGLTNDELALCDAVAYIPTAPEYRTLNLSHAVAVALYELFRRGEAKRVAGPRVMEQLQKFWGEILEELGYDKKKGVQERIFRRVIGRGSPTPREAHGMAGVLHKVVKKIKT
jgi:tRNA/rRNA methyltransferase